MKQIIEWHKRKKEENLEAIRLAASKAKEKDKEAYQRHIKDLESQLVCIQKLLEDHS